MSTSNLPVKKTSTPVSELLQKQVTRKEFMATTGLGIVSILGFSTIIHFLSGKKSSGFATTTRRTSGYGSHPYGS